jgi:hypothetical protein
MTAIQRAEQLFQKRFPEEMFIERLLLFLRFGYVISTPGLFAMFRPVCAGDALERIADPEYQPARPDAWFVDLAVGKLHFMPQLMPYPLPGICFWRKFSGGIRRYETKKLFRRIK